MMTAPWTPLSLFSAKLCIYSLSWEWRSNSRQVVEWECKDKHMVVLLYYTLSLWHRQLPIYYVMPLLHLYHFQEDFARPGGERASQVYSIYFTVYICIWCHPRINLAHNFTKASFKKVLMTRAHVFLTLIHFLREIDFYPDRERRGVSS